MCLNYKLSPIFYRFAQISLNCYKSVLRFSNRDFDRTFVEILNSPNLDFRLRVTTTAKLFHADKNVSNEILQRKIKKRIVLEFKKGFKRYFTLQGKSTDLGSLSN